MSYSQNLEEEVVLKYFGSHTGTFLDVGSNDGETLSNVRQLAINGWSGVCFEPCPEPFKKLEALYGDNDSVHTYNLAIGEHDGIATFYASGEHLGAGDTGLLSTLIKSEIDRWKGTEQFEEITVKTITWEAFELECLLSGFPIQFDFISVDAEGFDVEILEQMDLDAMGTKMVCVEWNSIRANKKRISAKLKGWKLIHSNTENLIYVKR